MIPRMIILNTPTEITPENILEILTQQNSELAMAGENIIPIFCYTTKRGTRNIVTEVNSEIRKRLTQQVQVVVDTVQGR
jgi:hypothetical protein